MFNLRDRLVYIPSVYEFDFILNKNNDINGDKFLYCDFVVWYKNPYGLYNFKKKQFNGDSTIYITKLSLEQKLSKNWLIVSYERIKQLDMIDNKLYNQIKHKDFS